MHRDPPQFTETELTQGAAILDRYSRQGSDGDDYSTTQAKTNELFISGIFFIQ